MSNAREPLAPMWPTDLDLTSPRRMLEHDTANAICANAHSYNSSVGKSHREYYDKLRVALANYHDATLQRVSCALSTAPHNFELLNLICYNDLTEETVNDWYMMVEHNIMRNAVLLYAAGLTVYKNLVPQRDGHYPAERLTQVAAIVRATEFLWGKGKAVAVDDPRRTLDIMVQINEEALRDQIDTSSDPTALADIIISRCLTTGKEVAEFLTATDQLQTPLKDGAL